MMVSFFTFLMVPLFMTSRTCASNLRAAVTPYDVPLQRHLIDKSSYCGFPLDMFQDPWGGIQNQPCAPAKTEQTCVKYTFFTQLPCLWENTQCSSAATRTGDDRTCPLARTEQTCASISFIGPRKCVWQIPPITSTPIAAPSQSPSESPSTTPTTAPTEISSLAVFDVPTGAPSRPYIASPVRFSKIPTRSSSSKVPTLKPSFTADIVGPTGDEFMSPSTFPKSSPSPTSHGNVPNESKSPSTIASSSPSSIPYEASLVSLIPLPTVQPSIASSATHATTTPTAVNTFVSGIGKPSSRPDANSSAGSKSSFLIAGTVSAGGILAVAMGIFCWRRFTTTATETAAPEVDQQDMTIVDEFASF